MYQMMRKQLTVTFWLLLSFVALGFLLSWLKGAMSGQWGSGSRWAYAQHMVFILLPLCMMLLLRRAPSLYGLSLSQIQRELAVGLAVVIWLVLVTFLAEALFSGLPSACRTIQLDVSTVVFAILFTGFGEELLFRGFYQGEFNRVFPRKFTFGQTRFGWSLFVTAALFGLAHIFGQFNPLQGRFDLNLGPVVHTMVAGLIFGIVREYFGGIVAASLIHGGGNLAFWLYEGSLVSMVGLTLAWALLAWFYFGVLHPKRQPTHPSSRSTDMAQQIAPADTDKPCR